MPEVDERSLQSRVDGILNRWPAVGMAVGVVRRGCLDAFYAHGLADIDAKERVTEETVFRIASVSKTFTAIAVLQLWEQGLVDLDAPANDYLRAFQLVPRQDGWPPATVRHLLTHTAGVPQWIHPGRMVNSGWFGESFPLGERLPALAEYYSGGLRLAVEPGTVWTYSDHGMATVGQIVEDVSGQPLHRYLEECIFGPLGMKHTDLRRSQRIQTHLVTGYTLGSKGPKAVTDREWVTAAAGSIYSTTRDMARYAAAILGGCENAAILEPETLAMMFEPHYQPDPRIPGMGLAFWRGNLGGHALVEHQGVLPGFNSQLTLAPDDGVGVVAFTNGARTQRPGSPVRFKGCGVLVSASDRGVRTDLAPHCEIWSDLCGWYRPRAQPTDMQAWSMLGLGVQVFVRRGRLVVRTLSLIPALRRGVQLHPDDHTDPYLFRVDLSQYGLGTARVVFSRDCAGATTGIHVDGLPLSADKRPTRTGDSHVSVSGPRRKRPRTSRESTMETQR